MRASAWRTKAAATLATMTPNSDATLSDPIEEETGTRDRPSHNALAQDVLAPPKPLSERLTLRFNVGMGLDGGQPSGKPRLSGATLDERRDYERLRIYSFGDAVLGTRGLGMQGLNSYLAAHFQYNQSFSKNSTALPSLYDQNISQPLIRSGYVEVDEIFSHRHLHPIHVRAGRSYQYGIAAFQFDGVTVGYQTPELALSVFGGARSDMLGLGNDRYKEEGRVTGLSVRSDLFAWKRWPLVLTTAALRFDGKNHIRAGLATAEQVNAAFSKAAAGELKGILGVSEEPLVSIDYNGNQHSATVDLAVTKVNGEQLKVLAWYDNEAGYSKRLFDLAEFVGKSL